MKDHEIQNQFIELKAKGHSFDTIAKSLNLGKSTLLRWNKKFEKDISDLEKIELSELKAKFLVAKKHRIELLSEMLNEIKTELKEQPVLLSYDKLVKLSLKIIQQFDCSEYYDFKKSIILNKNKENEEETELTEQTNEN
jgi:transposase